MNNLVCLFRACNLEVSIDSIKNISRPNWFSKQKCWLSFYNNFGQKENVNIIVIFDGKPEDELACYIKKFNIKNIVYLNNVGNKESLIYCYNLAEKLDFDYVFFAEDDYLYLPNSYEIMMEGLETFGEIGLVTLYDHPDRYFSNQDITKGHDYIFCCKTFHFRTAESTTGTVSMSKNIFNKVKIELINCNIHDCLFYRNILQKYDIRLFSSIPGILTHVNKFFLSPLINWEKYNNSIVL